MAQTLLIGLDGATMTVLGPLMDQGIMPYLKSFLANGAQASLFSTPHPLTPPAFVSMVTGRMPGDHGIYDFIRREERDGEIFFTLYDSRDIRCETIWSIANRQNRKVAALNFVITSPVSPVCGVIVPGMVHWKHLRRHTWPPEFYDRLKNQPWFDAKAMCWDFNHLREAIPVGTDMDQLGWIREHITRERQWFQVLRFILKKEPTDLVSVVFDGVDKLQHICWEFLDPAHKPEKEEPWHKEAIALCHQYFKELDEFLKELVELAGPRARTFIVSDHGFGPVFTTFRINQFLHDIGCLHWKGAPVRETKDGDEKSLNLDWSKTIAYSPTQSSNAIYMRVAEKAGEPGVPRAEYAAARERIVGELKKLKDPVKGGSLIKQVLLKGIDFTGIAGDDAPDITVVLFDHGFVSTGQGPVIERKPVVRGTHYPEGIFFAHGAGIRKGVKLEAHSIIDVAPTVLYSLDLPVPSNMSGKTALTVFEDAYVKENPLEVGPPAQEQRKDGAAPAAASGGERQAEEQNLVYDQLRALGYIE